MARESQASRKSGLPYIYGGISFLKGETNLVWYPSNGFQSPQGILLACYNTGDDARRFGALPVSDQCARTRGTVKLLNQGEGRVYLAGEHLSHINGWQEGALLSAIVDSRANSHFTSQLLDDRATWELARRLGENVELSYWKRKAVWPLDGELSDLSYAATEYMRVAEPPTVYTPFISTGLTPFGIPFVT
jgi:hypothetical protein